MVNHEKLGDKAHENTCTRTGCKLYGKSFFVSSWQHSCVYLHFQGFYLCTDPVGFSGFVETLLSLKDQHPTQNFQAVCCNVVRKLKIFSSRMLSTSTRFCFWWFCLDLWYKGQMQPTGDYTHQFSKSKTGIFCSQCWRLPGDFTPQVFYTQLRC